MTLAGVMTAYARYLGAAELLVLLAQPHTIHRAIYMGPLYPQTGVVSRCLVPLRFWRKFLFGIAFMAGLRYLGARG